MESQNHCSFDIQRALNDNFSIEYLSIFMLKHIYLKYHFVMIQKELYCSLSFRLDH